MNWVPKICSFGALCDETMIRIPFDRQIICFSSIDSPCAATASQVRRQLQRRSVASAVVAEPRASREREAMALRQGLIQRLRPSRGACYGRWIGFRGRVPVRQRPLARRRVSDSTLAEPASIYLLCSYSPCSEQAGKLRRAFGGLSHHITAIAMCSKIS